MKPFRLKINHKILYLLRAVDISPDRATAFFGQQVVSMQSCPPNYTARNNNKYARLEFNDKFWVMRGFFPSTPVMFKIIMVDDSSGRGESYYAKVELIVPTLQKKHAHNTMVDEKLWLKVMNDETNRILLGDNNPDPKITLTQRHPKCMSPKGMTVFNPGVAKKGI